MGTRGREADRNLRASRPLGVTTETRCDDAVLHERTRWVYEHLPVSMDRVLDVGCHDGSGLIAFAGRARLGVGIDLDLPALRRGVESEPSLRLLAANADALPFSDGAFDCVVFSEVLEHVPVEVEEQCIAELRRVMSEGATLIFTTPHRGAFWWLDPVMAKTHVRRLAALGSGTPPPKGHKHYRVREIERLLRRDFDILLVERRASLLHPLAYWGHLATSRLRGAQGLMRFWQSLIDADYSHEYGEAAYNLCLVARAR